MFYFTRKTKEFQMACTSTRHIVFFLCP